ncbi:MAG TPA: ribose 5-phosphate isomerase B [Cyclobacteriaceae bacterium]|nr:ribose 5-phosphate isomerase B [Cyclobacteriaceae bacterium]HMV07854.1 ribose 5-phosphate isomerase B [Cyclobacteriaceae bacterium]HMV88122.1 ribose 5-phosphate isomerase B [Cyclobacteriaceae bacterium]HMW98988.1 ribose 5-phosphate isomerase B [Cyclobacteriaceae bacterium]HMX48378.1 ribose 5-phosphate isomerase B [Cyclobacteriaceae bacterium]
MMPTIAIGADHAGFEFKEVLKKWLEKNAYKTKDFGTYNTESADYPDFAHPVAEAVEKKEFELGLLLCGSANGVAITANKHQGIRAAICWNEELAALARQHNNANVLCIPARYVSVEQAEKILDRFLHSSFEGGRHERRVNKISC